MSIQRNIRLLSWFNFFHDFRPHLPVLVLYLARETGSFTLGMTVLSMMAIAASLSEVPTGMLSDRIGRKKTVLLGALASTTGSILFAIGGSFGVLALGSVFVGIGIAFFSGNNDALLYETLKQEKREGEFGHFLGRTKALFQVGLGTSAVLGALTLSVWSIDTVMWVAFVPQAASLLIAFFFVEPTVHDRTINTNVFHDLREAVRYFIRNPRLRSLGLASMLEKGIGEAAFLFYPAFFEALWPLWAISAVRTIAHALAALSYWFAGHVMRRLRPLKTLIGAKAASHLVTLGALFFPSVLSPLLISGLSVFYGFKSTAEETLLQQEFTDRQRATMSSLTSFGASIIFAIASPLLGLAADTFGRTSALIGADLILFCVIFLYWRAFRHARH